MLSYPVNVSDGELTISFLHGPVQQPLVNAIEVMGGGSPPTADLSISPISDRSDTIGGGVSFSAVATGGDPSFSMVYSMSGAPDGITMDASTGAISGTLLSSALTGGLASDGVHMVTVSANRGPDSVDAMFVWTATDATTALVRIKAGGPTVLSTDGGPDWEGGS
ncbi:putative Ig domain-containing protein, partial [uncultured Croceitalea sp.]|uniref:putative Ig domain-containing protein n=1 Tax=uncultured Croceitalea sp. TaxID=1798908 RepID=UPI003306133C